MVKSWARKLVHWSPGIKREYFIDSACPEGRCFSYRVYRWGREIAHGDVPCFECVERFRQELEAEYGKG